MPRSLRSLRFLSACAVLVAARATDFPRAEWARATPAEAGMNEARLQQARDYALTGGGSGLVIRHSRLVYTWGDEAQRYDIKSSSKAVGVTLLGVALKDGKVALDDPAVKYQPSLGVPPESNRATGWLPQITLRQLANQTAGFEKPGGYGQLLFAPGTQWFYSDAGPNWLAECLTAVYARDLDEVMAERVFTPIGVKRSDIVWRSHAYRPKEMNGVKRREFGSGFSANVHALARLGYLYLHGGRCGAEQIIPEDFVRLVIRPAPENRGLPEYDETHGNASEHYSLLWWNNGDGTMPGVPRDAYWSWGLFDSLTVVVPSLDLVIVRAGPKSWARTSPGAEHYDPLRPLLEPIVASIREFATGAPQVTAAPATAPYRPSAVIARVEWAPATTIVRRAKGGDNWPMTWGDDDALFTAYGDGHGFEPFVPAKLSLGLSRVTGGPANFRGVNFTAKGGITYDAGFKRYRWCQVLPHSTHPQGPRFQGGCGIYDAPEPWGPWTTVFYTKNRDVGPGESSSLPTKWMSADGRTVHLVFSGNDSFSVRQATLQTAAP